MNLTDPGRLDEAGTEWADRRAANVRLALLLGALAVVVFALALWKFRPF